MKKIVLILLISIFLYLLSSFVYYKSVLSYANRIGFINPDNYKIINTFKSSKEFKDKLINYELYVEEQIDIINNELIEHEIYVELNEVQNITQELMQKEKLLKEHENSHDHDHEHSH